MYTGSLSDRIRIDARQLPNWNTDRYRSVGVARWRMTAIVTSSVQNLTSLENLFTHDMAGYVCRIEERGRVCFCYHPAFRALFVRGVGPWPLVFNQSFMIDNVNVDRN